MVEAHWLVAGECGLMIMREYIEVYDGMVWVKRV